MRKPFRYNIPDDVQPPPEVLAQSQQSLGGLSREIAVQQHDGIPQRAIVVSLMMSAIKLAAVTECFPPNIMRHMFEAIMERYSEDNEDGT